jgi:hypothetical protein
MNQANDDLTATLASIADSLKAIAAVLARTNGQPAPPLQQRAFIAGQALRRPGDNLYDPTRAARPPR